MSFSWSVTPSAAFVPGVAAYAAAIRNGVKAIADRRSPEIESWMKDNAVWTDRTGNSRQTLNTDVQELGMDMVTIILAHDQEVPGIYLELANAGKYAIVAPALDHWGAIVWADVQSLLR